MSLATPDKVRRLQRKLYVKAKQEPRSCFYQLYDKVYRPDVSLMVASARSGSRRFGTEWLRPPPS